MVIDYYCLLSCVCNIEIVCCIDIEIEWFNQGVLFVFVDFEKMVFGNIENFDEVVG